RRTHRDSQQRGTATGAQPAPHSGPVNSAGGHHHRRTARTMKPGSYPDLQNLARYLDPLHRYVKTCYVAHVKAMHGLVTRKAWNRQGPERLVPCPPALVPYIEAAMRLRGMIP